MEGATLVDEVTTSINSSRKSAQKFDFKWKENLTFPQFGLTTTAGTCPFFSRLLVRTCRSNPWQIEISKPDRDLIQLASILGNWVDVVSSQG
jgi:hypothetical protein